MEQEKTCEPLEACADSSGKLLPLKDVERQHIERVLESTGGSKRRAATILGISRWALARRLRKLGLAA